jgi:RNA polymerase sigma factor (sigma-70 family)
MTSEQAGIVLRHIRELGSTACSNHLPDAHLLERFTALRDEAAFALLVRRHGPMVLNVCRSVLHHEQDAEDAFQATFLVLARKAASVRQPEAVAGWLCEVAYRLAVKASARTRADSARRAQQRRACPLAVEDPTLDMTLRDLRRVLHEELHRLPDKYRLPLVLCYLEGHSHEEGAGLLGWSKGTFRGRLDRGRERLRRRLASRGVTLSALLCAAAVAPRAVAQALVDSAVRGAFSAEAGGAAAGAVSARAANLAKGAIPAMWTGKLNIATTLLLTVALVAAGVGALAYRTEAGREQPGGSAKAEARKREPAPVTAKAKRSAVDGKDSIAYSGRVLGPDGRPVAGAKLYMTLAVGYLKRPAPSPEYGKTGPDGRFQFKVSKAKFDDHYTVVAATAPRRGPGWVMVPAGGKRDGLTIRLVPDDMPITGQVVDLEGRPVPGATLTVLQIHEAPGADLGPWLAAARARKGLSWALEQRYLKHYTIALCPRVKADARGRLRLGGIGRNRLVRAQIDGPSIASQQVCILTRPGKPFQVMVFEGSREYGDPSRFTTYHGAKFRFAAAPTKPIVGVVRDRDTKKPLAGVTIQSYKMANSPIHGMNIVRTTTDARGRYRLTGMPKGKSNKIMVVPPDDQPYVAIHATVPDSPGFDPVKLDIGLKRGVWIEGKITDKLTGKPLKATVEYFSLSRNPSVRDYPGFDGRDFRFVAGKEDGSYRVVGLPGPGVVGVYYQRDPYLRASDRKDEYGLANPASGGPALLTAPYILFFPSNYSAIARVNPARGVQKVKRDVTLDPGWTFKGTVLGPDGKPLAGARRFDWNSKRWWQREQRKAATFTGGFNPRHPCDIVFQYPEKGLVGAAHPPKKNGGSVNVRMGTGAAVTGRLIDADGRPRTGVRLAVSFRPKGWGSWYNYSPKPTRTDRKGRFRIAALLPDYEFRLSDGKGEVPLGGGLRSGKAKDLGDLRMKTVEK